MSRIALNMLCGALFALFVLVGAGAIREMRALERIAAQTPAAPPPLRPEERVHAASMSSMPAFQKSCTSTASRVEPSAEQKGYLGIWVWNGTGLAGASATPVYFGDASVTTTNGMPLCAGNCPRADQDYATTGLYCITAGTTVTVTGQIARP